MSVFNDNGVDLLELWEREKTFLRAEVIGGNISLWFTGVVARRSVSELVLARDSDELSISLFFESYKIFEPSVRGSADPVWERYKRVVQITTDGGAQCTLYELKECPSDSKNERIDIE
ncbi:MAG: hypothetical protein ACREA2_05970 [Blastocatellia bacterium]